MAGGIQKRMNYYEPRQRESDQRWDFTCQNDDHVWPVGYCRPWLDVEEREGDPVITQLLITEEKRALPFKDKHHSNGHETAEEAAQCYRQYLLDQKLRLMGEAGERRECNVCDEMTNLYAEIINGPFLSLCKAHNNRETVEKLYSSAPMKIVSSY